MVRHVVTYAVGCTEEASYVLCKVYSDCRLSSWRIRV
jgi:hypothetical protein